MGVTNKNHDFIYEYCHGKIEHFKFSRHFDSKDVTHNLLTRTYIYKYLSLYVKKILLQ